MKKNNYGVIYKITNNINGKIYIGQTTATDPYKRINKHFKKTSSKDLVFDAYNKYGKEALDAEIIISTFDQDSLNDLEIYFIDYYKSLIPNGYNIKLGGAQGGKLLEETKLFIGQQIREYYKTHVAYFKGKKFTKEHCESLSKVRKGFDSPSRKKIREKTYENRRLKIKAIHIETGLEHEFKSIQECADILNLDAPCVSRTLTGKQNRSQHKGYRFVKI